MGAHTVKYGGERIDRIAKAMLQTEQAGTVEALLAANTGLAALLVNGVAPEGAVIQPPASFDPTPSAVFTLAWE